MSSDLDDCGCWEEDEGAPSPLHNPPGLSRIAYRLGTFSQFRASLLGSIAKRHELAGLSTRLGDDYAITVLDLWATIGDVLTFYQEEVANEAFLASATLRDSVLRMVRLIDYQLAPGVAATGLAALFLDDGPAVQIPAGLRIQSVPGEGEKPQKFETAEAIKADPRLSSLAVRPRPALVKPLVTGRTSAYVSSELGGTLSPGDRLILFANVGLPEVVEIKEVLPEANRMRVVWTGQLKHTWDPFVDQVFRVKRSFRLFGFNHPVQFMLPSSPANVPGGIKWELVPLNDQDFQVGIGGISSLYLDDKYDGLPTGVQLVVSGLSLPNTTPFNHLVNVREAVQEQHTFHAATGSVTRLMIEADTVGTLDLRSVVVRELEGPQVTFSSLEYPDVLGSSAVFLPVSRLAGGRVEVGRRLGQTGKEMEPGVPLDPNELEPGCRVILQDGRTSVPARIAGVSMWGTDIEFGPTPEDPTTVAQLGLLADQAQPATGLMSRRVVPLPLKFTSTSPEILLTIDGRERVVKVPATANSFQQNLQAAIRASDAHPSFGQAVVRILSGRIVILPGGAETSIHAYATPSDGTTVFELGLDEKSAGGVWGLVSGPVDLTAGLVSPVHHLFATLGPVADRLVAMDQVDIDTIAAAVSRLFEAIVNADSSPFFRGVSVVAVGNRIVVLPGVRADAQPEEHLRIDLNADAPATLHAHQAVLLGNVVSVSHGETVREEVLGDGDATKDFQVFKLRNKPLTYAPDPSSGSLSSSLTVLVNRIQWLEVPSFYGQLPDARVFTVRAADDGTSEIRFGDGRTGARPPTGRGNVSAFYRKGAGLAGRVRAGTLSTLLDRPIGLRSATNPLPTEGGADPERLKTARLRAPGTVRTFGRAVSIEDFEDLAMASGEIAKARATWVWSGQTRIVHLTLAGAGGTELSPTKLAELHAGLSMKRDPNHTLVVGSFVRVAIVLGATLHVVAGHVAAYIAAAAREALVLELSFEKMDLGRPLHLSDFNRILQDVPGVDWVTIDLFTFKNRSPLYLASRGATQDPVQHHLRIWPARVVPGSTLPVAPAEQAYVEHPSLDLNLATAGGLSF